jgi:hypothetical protein
VILLWGLAAEGPLARVRDELAQMGAACLLVNQHDVLATEVRLEVGPEVCGYVRTPEARVALEDVTAAYLRPYDSGAVPDVRSAGRPSAEWRHALTVEELLWSWADVTPALVVNRASAMAANGSKPFQAELIRRFGFAVPGTLLTSDPTAAAAFWERHGEVIYKSVSGVRSIVSRLGPAHRERLADVASCPTQFQAYVPGTEYRVHVVGEELFVCRIVSEATDYRYHGEHAVELCAAELPGEVADRCRSMAAAMELPVAGIDLRQTPDGDWYCFEVNPSPGFDYFQSRAGLPIAAAIARLLIAGAPPGRPAHTDGSVVSAARALDPPDAIAVSGPPA